MAIGSVPGPGWGMKGDGAGRSGAADPKGWTFEKLMRANAGGSVAIAYRDAKIVAPLADIRGAIELLRSAPDRRQILRSVNRSLRQDFNSVVRRQASQQTAMHVMQDIALWFANEVIEGRATLDEH